MDALRTLLLARAHVVALDPDRVAAAATRPARDNDLDRFEDELAQLGFVMSLDLAMTIRRLPYHAMQELRGWMSSTLGAAVGADRPHVPLFRGFPAGTPEDTQGLYRRRVLTWLLTEPAQPCPWCGQVTTVGSLDPCGHLVCHTCWSAGSYAGCPICHRRCALGEPFVKPVTTRPPPPADARLGDGQLRLLHLAFDALAFARDRFGRLLARATPLSPDDRAEVEAVIDMLGPQATSWLPARIPVKETAALVVARLWLVSPDRAAIRALTAAHIRTATDVLRVAVVLMGGDPGLVEKRRVRSLPRSLRRTLLEALDALPLDAVLDDVRRHPGLWTRVGERLHPYEHAARLPTAALAFASVRNTSMATASFGAALAAHAAPIERVRITDNRVRVSAWAGRAEEALGRGDAGAAAAHLATRPGELLRRADHVVRTCVARQPAALDAVLAHVRGAITHGAPGTLLTLAAHIAQRDHAWRRRVFLPAAEVLRAWGTADLRPPLPAAAIAAIVGAAHDELLRRAARRRPFARAVIDRGLVDLLVPFGERNAARARVAWPRGSEIPLPGEAPVRLFLHWEEPPGTRVDLDLSVALYDEAWRHIATCDYGDLVVGPGRAAVHSGDLTNAPPPLGASEFVDLDIAALHALGARHAVMVVFSFNRVSFDRLPHGFAGVMLAPAEGQPFDARAVAQRFDLGGRSQIVVPLTIDLTTRRLRWLDVHLTSQDQIHAVGGQRAALAHIGRDFADLVSTGARPTLLELAGIHAAARANVIYVREPGGRITQVRRRDGETTRARLDRLRAGDGDGTLAALPAGEVPTWFAVLRDDLTIPASSEGYILDARAASPAVTRLAAGDLIAQLAP